jgi:hypothetical protein
MPDEVLTVAELERLATTAEGYATAGGHTFWFATVARVCRHALALHKAIAEHHGQRADDRCWLDNDRLYAAAGLPPADVRVGDQEAMLANCRRYIQRCTEGGGWPSYAELEAEIARLRRQVEAQRHEVHEDDGDA